MEGKTGNMMKPIKLVMLGIATVGKSSITLQWFHGSFSEDYNPTLQEIHRKNITLDEIPSVVGKKKRVFPVCSE
jgi:GTPase SAR1 family protein